MAKTWRTGQFGLTSFNDHDISLSSLIDHFNDNIDNNYSDYPIPDDSNFTDIPQPLGKVSEPTYTTVPDSTMPTYIDLIKNT